MDIEEDSHKNFKKDLENKLIKEFQNEILQKNQKLLFVENLFSEHYNKFLQDLIKSLEEPNNADRSTSIELNEGTLEKKLEKVFNLIWAAYVTVVLRSNDANTQRSLFEWIYKKIDEVLRF